MVTGTSLISIRSSDGKSRKDELTEEQIAEIHTAFGMFDINNDGVISCQELGSLMRSLGLRPTDKEIQEIVRAVDANESGEIDFPEFIEMLQSHWKSDDLEEKIREAFKIFDKDGSGFIEAEELRTIMIQLGDDLTTEEVAEMIKIADKNGDGRIDYHEFADFVAANKK